MCGTRRERPSSVPPDGVTASCSSSTSSLWARELTASLVPALAKQRTQRWSIKDLHKNCVDQCQSLTHLNILSAVSQEVLSISWNLNSRFSRPEAYNILL